MDVDVMVCSGGKCGSSTLRNTFQKMGYKCIKFHHKHCFISQFKNDKIMESINISSKNKKLYIIDSYRLPLERKISSFFENIDTHLPSYRNLTITEIIDIFNKKYLRNIENYPSMMDTIMDDLKIPHFQIFNFNKKYNIKECGNIVFITLRFRDIIFWGDILSEILGKEINLNSENLTSKKRYTEYIKNF